MKKLAYPTPKISQEEPKRASCAPLASLAFAGALLLPSTADAEQCTATVKSGKIAVQVSAAKDGQIMNLPLFEEGKYLEVLLPKSYLAELANAIAGKGDKEVTDIINLTIQKNINKSIETYLYNEGKGQKDLKFECAPVKSPALPVVSPSVAAPVKPAEPAKPSQPALASPAKPESAVATHETKTGQVLPSIDQALAPSLKGGKGTVKEPFVVAVPVPSGAAQGAVLDRTEYSYRFKGPKGDGEVRFAVIFVASNAKGAQISQEDLSALIAGQIEKPVLESLTASGVESIEKMVHQAKILFPINTAINNAFNSDLSARRYIQRKIANGETQAALVPVLKGGAGSRENPFAIEVPIPTKGRSDFGKELFKSNYSISKDTDQGSVKLFFSVRFITANPEGVSIKTSMAIAEDRIFRLTNGLASHAVWDMGRKEPANENQFGVFQYLIGRIRPVLYDAVAKSPEIRTYVDFQTPSLDPLNKGGSGTAGDPFVFEVPVPIDFQPDVGTEIYKSGFSYPYRGKKGRGEMKFVVTFVGVFSDAPGVQTDKDRIVSKLFRYANSASEEVLNQNGVKPNMLTHMGILKVKMQSIVDEAANSNTTIRKYAVNGKKKNGGDSMEEVADTSLPPVSKNGSGSAKDPYILEVPVPIESGQIGAELYKSSFKYPVNVNGAVQKLHFDVRFVVADPTDAPTQTDRKAMAKKLLSLANARVGDVLSGKGSTDDTMTPENLKNSMQASASVISAIDEASNKSLDVRRYFYGNSASEMRNEIKSNALPEGFVEPLPAVNKGGKGTASEPYTFEVPVPVVKAQNPGAELAATDFFYLFGNSESVKIHIRLRFIETDSPDDKITKKSKLVERLNILIFPTVSKHLKAKGVTDLPNALDTRDAIERSVSEARQGSIDVSGYMPGS